MARTVNMRDLSFDQNAFSIDELRSVADEIFSAQEKDFQKLKKAKWYERLLRAVTFGVGDRKHIIRDVRDLSAL